MGEASLWLGFVNHGPSPAGRGYAPIKVTLRRFSRSQFADDNLIDGRQVPKLPEKLKVNYKVLANFSVQEPMHCRAR